MKFKLAKVKTPTIERKRQILAEKNLPLDMELMTNHERHVGFRTFIEKTADLRKKRKNARRKIRRMIP